MKRNGRLPGGDLAASRFLCLGVEHFHGAFLDKLVQWAMCSAMTAERPAVEIGVACIRFRDRQAHRCAGATSTGKRLPDRVFNFLTVWRFADVDVSSAHRSDKTFCALLCG
jgi:hypothetical protein